MPKPVWSVIRAVTPYCSKIRMHKKHYVCYPVKGDKIITISASSSDRNYYKNVYKDFKKCGLDIPDILKNQ